MPSGGEILEAIDRRLGKLRRDAETVDEQFRRAGDELTAARHAELAVFAGLARLRLEEIESGELRQCFDDIDRQVTEILQVRKAAEQSLAAKISAGENALAAAERERAHQQSVVAAAAQEAERAAKQARDRLEGNAEYGSLLAAAREAHAIAEHAEAKAAAAESDRVAKTKPYDDDPVFTYLWQRGYGTSAYRSSPLIRMLDSALARASGYERLRRNYRLLHEIPRRLAEHSRRMRLKAENSLSAARALETQAAAAAGVAPTQRALCEAQQRLADVDSAVETHEAALDAAIESRARFAAGEDEHSTRCTQLLAEALARADRHELRKKAARTSSEEDNELIADLERLEQERESRQRDVIELRRLHQSQRERTLGLEEVRRRFKQNRFDDVHAQFANGPLIDSLLERFVSGAIGIEELSEGIARQQRGRIGNDAQFATDELGRRE